MKFITELLAGEPVQFRPLGDVFDMRNGYTPSKSNADYWVGGVIPWFRMEDIRLNGRILSDAVQHITPQAVKGSGLFKAGSIIMATTATIGEHALLIVDSLANQQFTNFSIRKSLADKLDTKFVYYYFFILGELCLQNVNVSSFPSVDMDWLKRQMFPILPLRVQRKIVEILDNFAELTARQKQYEYYRNRLLSFDKIGGDLTVLWKPLGEVGEFVRGNGLQKKDFTNSGVPAIHYGQIYTYYGLSTKHTKSFVSEEFAKKARKAKHGNLIIATTSENDEDVCKAVAWLGSEEVAVSSDACFYTHSLEPKYVAYWFQTEQFQEQKRTYITGTKVRRVNASDLGKIIIPIPPLEEQRRIVEVLDRFDTLAHSLTEGLPREIELRQKQYEYYRNQLLSFA